MIDQQLLEILVCPDTHQAVSPASEEVLGRLNAAIEAGGVVNRGGKPVETVLDAGLVREDGRMLYPVRDGIPIMLIDESIPLESTK